MVGIGVIGLLVVLGYNKIVFLFKIKVIGEVFGGDVVEYELFIILK